VSLNLADAEIYMVAYEGGCRDDDEDDD